MSKFAIIETGGRQYCVEENAIIDIDIFKDCKEDSNVDFDKVLLFDDGNKTILGKPYIKDNKVVGVIEKIGRKKKISVIRFHSKTNYHRHKGHRQHFCRVRIKTIN